ncbi:MAG: hypothetical protein AAFX58_06090 [Pseudomonadota bacterium]
MKTTATRTIALVSALLLSAAAHAGVELEDAFELSSTNVELPASIGGSVILRECSRCDRVTVRVRSESLYFIGKTPVTLAQLRAAFDAREARGETFGLVVFRDRASGFVSRIIIEL